MYSRKKNLMSQQMEEWRDHVGNEMEKYPNKSLYQLVTVSQETQFSQSV